MFRDLREITSPQHHENTSVCIVGGGTAGLFLAQRLRQFQRRVLILEAGDSCIRRPLEIDQICEQRGIRYRGADLGRSFGVGGTSALWGGQLLPLTASDMAERPEIGVASWPLDAEDLAVYMDVVEQTFGLNASNPTNENIFVKSSFPALERFDADFDLRLSKWLPFRKRNFAQAFADQLASDPDLVVWLNAPVTELSTASSGQINAIKARQNDRILTVSADVVVICAGALESTRILLELDRYLSGSLSAAGSPIGQYFADHLSVTCGRIRPLQRKQFNHAIAPIFVKGIMRTPRLELSRSAQETYALPSAFAHFTFVTQGNTGFDVVRDFLRRRQGEMQNLGLAPSTVAKAFTDVVTMGYWRGIHKRLWIPNLADILLQVDIEQLPNPDSRLSLSEQRDGTGRRRLTIDWRLSDRDVDVIRAVSKLIAAAWDESSLRTLASLELTLPDKLDSFDSLYDVYHPTGSLRMGRSSRDSVVDRNLRIWGLQNCFVCSTAVFPTAGSANPGLTHLALTARLAAHIDETY